MQSPILPQQETVFHASVPSWNNDFESLQPGKPHVPVEDILHYFLKFPRNGFFLPLSILPLFQLLPLVQLPGPFYVDNINQCNPYATVSGFLPQPFGLFPVCCPKAAFHCHVLLRILWRSLPFHGQAVKLFLQLLHCMQWCHLYIFPYNTLPYRIMYIPYHMPALLH